MGEPDKDAFRPLFIWGSRNHVKTPCAVRLAARLPLPILAFNGLLVSISLPLGLNFLSLPSPYGLAASPYLPVVEVTLPAKATGGYLPEA